LVTVLTKINNMDARTSEHQREALLFYLGGEVTLQALRSDSQEDPSCIACTSNPGFSDILYDARAALTPAQVEAYDQMHLEYPLLTHYISDAIPKTPDGVWLKPCTQYPGDPVGQAKDILEKSLAQFASPLSPLPLGVSVTYPALCDGSIDMGGGAGRAAILCYVGSFLSSLFGKLNNGMERSSEHVRKATLLYLMNTDAAISAAKTGEEMNDKSCTLCFSAPNLAGALDSGRAARTDLERRQYSAASASAGLWPHTLNELVWDKLLKSADGVMLRADPRFGGDAPSQAAAVIRTIFVDLDSAHLDPAASAAARRAAGRGGMLGTSTGITTTSSAGAVLVLTMILLLLTIGWAWRKLGTTGLYQLLCQGPAPWVMSQLARPDVANGSPQSPRFARLNKDVAEETTIKNSASNENLEGMNNSPSRQTLGRDGKPTRPPQTFNSTAFSDSPQGDRTSAATRSGGDLLPRDVLRSDAASAAAANGLILSRTNASRLRLVILALCALLLLAGGGMIFASSTGAAVMMAGPMGNMLLAGTVMAPNAPSSHVFTHGHDLAAPREYSVTMLKLPTNVGEIHVNAEQTHEIYFDSATRTAFVSVVTSSRLLQLPLAPTGVMAPMVRSWVVGHPDHNEHPELAALHNVAGSYRHPGMLWVSTEGDDRVYLVDPTKGFAIKYAMHVPTSHVDSRGKIHNVGGPHSVREAPDGTVWVCLKGADPEGAVSDPELLARQQHMLEMRFEANHEPVPDGWAVWHVDPEHYDATVFPDKGGVMFDALQSPTMTAIDGFGNTWHTQDKSSSVLHVTADGVAEQIALPNLGGSAEVPEWSFANGNGPGIVTDPLGNVWLCNLVPGQPWMVRFASGSSDPLIFKDLGSGQDDGSRHVIHMAFSSKGGPSGTANVLYALTSALLDHGATESVIMLEMDERWENARLDGEVGRQEIVLPTRNSAAHRVAVVDTVSPHSVVVTGLLTNTIFQIMGPGI
jgi:hypothetical protein